MNWLQVGKPFLGIRLALSESRKEQESHYSDENTTIILVGKILVQLHEVVVVSKKEMTTDVYSHQAWLRL